LLRGGRVERGDGGTEERVRRPDLEHAHEGEFARGPVQQDPHPLADAKAVLLCGRGVDRDLVPTGRTPSVLDGERREAGDTGQRHAEGRWPPGRDGLALVV